MESENLFFFEPVYDFLTAAGHAKWAGDVRRMVKHAVGADHHGNLESWIKAWHQIPAVQRLISVEEG